MAALLACVTVWSAATAFGQAVETDGRRIVDLIAALRDQGITVIYSNELVPETLRARGAPGEANPLEYLSRQLEAHGLALRAGPRGSWLVVRRPSPPDQDAGAGAEQVPRLILRPPALEDIVVSASRYAFSRAPGASTTRLNRMQIENDPSFGHDALRAIHALPGLSSSGLSARFNVRGGASDEALLLLDGVQLFNPFHLKDFESIFSSINPDIVESMAIYTGAFSAEYGGRMSAVVDMQTITPVRKRQHEIRVSLLDTSVLSSGSFAEGRGSWTTSARRGNLDLLMDAADSEWGRPRYVDFYNKLSYDINDAWTASFGILALNDEISLRDPLVASADADYEDTYLWSRFDYSGDKLSAAYLVADTALMGDRVGFISDPQRSTGSLSDVRSFESLALKADWSYAISDAYLLRWGAEHRRSDSSYLYAATRTAALPLTIVNVAQVDPNVNENLAFDGAEDGLYLSFRARPATPLTAEFGLRWDHQDFLADRQLSPRISILYDRGSRASFRASWGHLYQPQRLDEVAVNNGLTTLLPTQESEHTVLGFEYLAGNATMIRFEAYEKKLEHLSPRFENLFTKVGLLPELLPDRVVVTADRGRASGIEFSVESELEHWDWWLNLSRSDTADLFGDAEVPRSWHQRWSAKAGAIWHNGQWTLAVASTWHSGWPVTGLALGGSGLLSGPFNAERLGQFDSLDVRASRLVSLEHGELEWFVELSNVLDRNNPCCVDYLVDFDALSQPSRLTLGTNNWLPTFPAAGFRWRFFGRQ